MALVGKNDPDFRLTFDYNIKARQNQLLLESGDFGNLLIQVKADYWGIVFKIVILYMFLYALILNLPCILLQRYNRPRLIRVRNQLLKKSGSSTPEVNF